MASKILYPPLIDSSMPSFISSKEVKIYFSFPPMNTIEDVNKDLLQVTLVLQNNNKNMLNNPNELVFKTIYQEEDKFYFILNSNDLKTNSWIINNLYKLQIRFSDASLSRPTAAATATWLTENLDLFSEWSSVCLLKPIEQPVVNIRLDEIYTSDTLVFNASFIFNNQNSVNEEFLSRYSLTLINSYGIKKTINEVPVTKNEINTIFPYELQQGEYQIILSYVTNNNYSDSIKRNINVVLNQDSLEGSFKYSCSDFTDEMLECNDLENARIRLEWSNLSRDKGNIIIRRSSTKSNFMIWDNLCSLPINAINYLDYTIEPGIFYKYRIYVKENDNLYGPLYYLIDNKEYPIMISSDNIYLSDKNQQLKIKFDGQISSYQIKIVENVTETIGSKYPYIKRNGDTYYRTFSMSGLITSLMDMDFTFNGNEEILYDENSLLYKQYNKDNDINDYNDYIKEKLFREKVLSFLYNSKPKLFRSLTEGNILVKLTNISLTPNQTLGRMIYSFSATVTEIDDVTIKNLQKYNIIEEVG